MNYIINEKEYTLAQPTPLRISNFLKLYKKNSLSELLQPEKNEVDQKSIEFGKLSLNLIGDVNDAKKLLDACLNESVELEIVQDLPIAQIAQINMDFFFQLIAILYAPVK